MIEKIGFSGYKSQNVSYDLKRCNLVTGPMGSGKTSIYEAIHIALTGKHPYLGDLLSSIKKQSSEDEVSFKIDFDGKHVERNIVFGEKTLHTVSINGIDTKIKEAEKEIEGSLGGMMRLDISKFSKMNDLERGTLLSELLGSSKMERQEIARDVLDQYYRSYPESEFIIKYRMGAKLTSYDKSAFIAAMKDVIATDKNPAIISAIEICEEILRGDGGVVDAADALDEMYASIKRVRDAKAQEKNYSQKTFAEMTSRGRDIGDVQAELEGVKESLELAHKDEKEINDLISASKYLHKPKRTPEELRAEEKTIADTIREISLTTDITLKFQKDIEANLGSLNIQIKEHQEYARWEETINVNKMHLDNTKDRIKALQDSIRPESKEKSAVLDRAKAHYLAIKEISSGECPTCGTIISEERVKQQKAEKRLAKQEYDNANKELALRKNNDTIRGTIKALKEQLMKDEANIKDAQSRPPLKPNGTQEELEKEKETLINEGQSVGAQVIKLMKEKRDAEDQNTMIADEFVKWNSYNSAMQELEPLIKKHANNIAEDDLDLHLLSEQRAVGARVRGLMDKMGDLRGEEEIHEQMKSIQENVVNLTAEYNVFSKVCESIRTYKGELVANKIMPVQLLAKKYYAKKGDDIVLTPKDIGVKRSGQYIEWAAMSGGERLTLMSAVIVAIMEASEITPKYLFIDAAEIDEENIVFLLDALEQSSVDTLIVAHHMPIKAPKGWNHIALKGK